jgi:hypothetical protein
MIVLDTNVVSELMRAEPAGPVVAWLDRQFVSDIHLSAVTVAELFYGVARLPAGRRKDEIASRVEGMVSEFFGHRVLAFDEPAAGHYAEIVVARERLGRPVGIADAQIASICRRHRGVLVTRNTDDFADVGVELVDPWVVGQA